MRTLVVSAAVIATLLASSSAFARQAVEQSRQPAIVSTGSATVSVAPDRSFVTLSVETLDPSPSAAQQKNAQAMTAVRSRLEALGLTGDAVRTVRYELNEQVEFVNNRREVKGYRAVNQIEVRVDEIDRVGKIVDAAVQAGATNVADIRFDIKDRDSMERQALKLAVADARARAEAMAAGSNVAIGSILRIEELGGAEPPRPMPQYAEAMRAVAADTPVSAGKIEVRASVRLTVSVK
jgi:uncharacterized protein YggE